MKVLIKVSSRTEPWMGIVMYRGSINKISFCAVGARNICMMCVNLHESDTNVARTCRARSVQKGMLLLDPSVTSPHNKIPVSHQRPLPIFQIPEENIVFLCVFFCKLKRFLQIALKRWELLPIVQLKWVVYINYSRPAFIKVLSAWHHTSNASHYSCRDKIHVSKPETNQASIKSGSIYCKLNEKLIFILPWIWFKENHHCWMRAYHLSGSEGGSFQSVFLLRVSTWCDEHYDTIR
jgi:hypothetical protein